MSLSMPEPAKALADERAGEASFAGLLRSSGGAPRLDAGLAAIAAEEQPGVRAADALAALDDAAAGVRVLPGAGVYERVARVNRRLFDELGLRADGLRPDDPAPALLDRVLAEGLGLPAMLAAVWVAVGRRVGLDPEPVAFPGHYLVALAGPDARFFVDPSRRGAVLREVELRERLALVAGSADVEPETWARFVSRVSDGAVLLRLCRALAGIHARRDDWAGALRALDRVLLLEPEAVVEHRDRGTALMKLGRREEAREAFATYLALEPEAWDRARVQVLLATLAG